MIPPIEQLRNDILGEDVALGDRPITIRNHFTTIVQGLHSMVGCYDNVIHRYSQVH